MECLAFIADGLYIELHKRPSVSELMDDARKKAASLPPVVEGDDKEEMDEEEMENETCNVDTSKRDTWWVWVGFPG